MGEEREDIFGNSHLYVNSFGSDALNIMRNKEMRTAKVVFIWLLSGGHWEYR